jgi:lipoprotein-anchoring transpeptidase ErfK/SrfK
LLLAGLLLAGCVHTQVEPASDVTMTARDKKLLANAPYAKANIPVAYQRAIVRYHRKEARGSIVVDSDARYLYYVLPDNQAIRYGVIVGEEAQSWSGVAKVGRKEEWPSWTPTEGEKRASARFRTTSRADQPIRWARAGFTFIPAARIPCTVFMGPTSLNGSDTRSRPGASG